MQPCPHCQTLNPPNAKFCNECGQPLLAPATNAPEIGVQLNNSTAGSDVTGRDKVTVDSSGQGAFAAGRDVNQSVVVTGAGARIFIGEQPIVMTAVERDSALGKYLSHVISRNRYLQLQGIRSGGKLVNIELDQIYITLKATRQKMNDEGRMTASRDERRHSREGGNPEWLADDAPRTETVYVKVEEALAGHKRMVVLGDPGSGKTTLLRYLALCYARDRAEGLTFVRDQLGLPESGYIPILLPLRNLGAYLKSRFPTEDVEGHACLLDFLRDYLKNGRIAVPDDFFDADLEAGRAVLLLDGMDEVGAADLRRRVARLIDSFAAAYPQCRLIVTSRVVGYTGAARLGEDFTTTTVQDFLLADVEQFLSQWHRLVAIGQMGAGESAEHFAAAQTAQLLNAIKANPRVRELAINPLMLTVIALVHRDRVKLPDRRAELYAEAVDVLLGKWDEARGVAETRILEDRPFDTNDRRLLLQRIALGMHEAGKKEIEADDLRRQLKTAFLAMVGDERAAERAADRFLHVVQERTGLLVEAGQGVYRFSHLTFEEYLAALALIARDDYVDYALQRSGRAAWREVILLAVGQLSTTSVERTTKLVQRIADYKNEPTLYHNLLLAMEAIRDVGNAIDRNVAVDIQARLKSKLQAERPAWSKLLGQRAVKSWVEERSRVIETLARSGVGYWTLPYGEPEWVKIPAGEFWLGSDETDKEAEKGEKPLHRLSLPEYQIARVPITNAQYLLYVQATGAKSPQHWRDGQPPKDKASHPVVYVSWHDARAYCEWLSKVTGKLIRLPTEAEWEKAARGDKDKRIYPWGDVFDSSKCNTSDLGLRDTSPVGVFPEGASPYGCLDMGGNVWEWTQSLWDKGPEKPEFKYPYNSKDGREDLKAPDSVYRVLRGGSFVDEARFARCACRSWGYPGSGNGFYGCRVCVAAPILSRL